MSRIYTYILFFGFLNLCCANQIDSLKNLLHSVKHDTERVKILKLLCLKEAMIDIEIAKRYKDSTQELAKKINTPKYLAIGELCEANIFYNTSRYKESIKHYRICNELLNNTDEVFIAGNYSDMSYCYYRLGQTDSFYFYCTKAIKLYEKNKREDKLTRTYGNMAYILTNIGKHSDARKYFNLSNFYALKINDLNTLGRNKQNQGIMYENLGQYDSALTYYQDALKIKLKVGDSLAISTSYSGIASIYLEKRKFKEFLFFERKYIGIAHRLKNIEYEANGYRRIGEGFLILKNVDSAIFYFSKSIKLNELISDLAGASDCNKFLSKCYELKGDYKNAFFYHHQYKVLYDSLFNSQRVEQLENLKISFETEKKEQENKLLQAENALSNKTIKQQNIITYFIIGGLIVVSSLAFFIFKGLKKQRKANTIITLQKKEVERQKSIVEEQKHKVEEHQKEILDSIHYAKRIQTALLANREHVKTYLKDSFIYFNPKDIVSGDFYWATNHVNSQGIEYFYLAVCDSTGHGVPGAFMSLLNIGFLSEAIKEKNIELPNEVFNYVRQRLIGSISGEGQKDGFDGILVRFNCSELSGKSEKLNIVYAAANNEPILVRNEAYVELAKDKMPVGKGERTEDFTLQSIELFKGDVLYLYTDGYADQFGGEKGKKFKYKQLNEMLLSKHKEPMNKQEQILSETFNNWRGNLEQVDDICIIGIKI